jgi:predicted transcriptional regulator
MARSIPRYYLNTQKLEGLLLEQGLTSRQLAERAGFHVQRLYRAEWGQPATRDTLARIAYTLRVDVRDLIMFEKEEVRQALKKDGPRAVETLIACSDLTSDVRSHTDPTVEED